MLVITANTLRQQLTNTEGTACGCDLPKWLLMQKDKRQLFVFISISTILLPLLKNIGYGSLIRGDKLV